MSTKKKPKGHAKIFVPPTSDLFRPPPAPPLPPAKGGSNIRRRKLRKRKSTKGKYKRKSTKRKSRRRRTRRY